MTIARSAADVLSGHVGGRVRGPDVSEPVRPKLQYESGVVGFLRVHRGATFASSALTAPMTRQFVSEIERFAEREGVDLVTFEKGQRKDDVAHDYLAGFGAEEGGCSSARRRRRRRRSAPSGAATPRRARAIVVGKVGVSL